MPKIEIVGNQIILREDIANGDQSATITAPSSLTSCVDFVLPTTGGIIATQAYVDANAGGGTAPTCIQGSGDPATYSIGYFNLVVVGIATGGTYTLDINGVETAPIDYDHSNLESILTDALGADVPMVVDASSPPNAYFSFAPINGYGALTFAIGTSTLTGTGSPEMTIEDNTAWTDAEQSSVVISSQYVDTLTGDVWLMSKDTLNEPAGVIRKTWRLVTGN